MVKREMKLFITVPNSLTEPAPDWDQDLLIMLACLEAEGKTVGLIDNRAIRLGVDELLGYIKEFGPDAEVIVWKPPNNSISKQYFLRISNSKIYDNGDFDIILKKYTTLDLPYPAWKHLPLDTYYQESQLPYSQETLNAQRRIHMKWSVLHNNGSKTKFTPEKMCRMITYLKLRTNLDFITFHDDVTEDKPWTQQFLLELDEQDLTGTFSWGANASITDINYPDLESLRERKCSYLDYGVHQIEKLAEEINFNRAVQAIRYTKQNGITPVIRTELNSGTSLDAILKVAEMLKAEDVIQRPVVKLGRTLFNWNQIELLGIAELIDTGDTEALNKIPKYD